MIRLEPCGIKQHIWKTFFSEEYKLNGLLGQSLVINVGKIPKIGLPKSYFCYRPPSHHFIQSIYTLTHTYRMGDLGKKKKAKKNKTLHLSIPASLPLYVLLQERRYLHKPHERIPCPGACIPRSAGQAMHKKGQERGMAPSI